MDNNHPTNLQFSAQPVAGNLGLFDSLVAAWLQGYEAVRLQGCEAAFYKTPRSHPFMEPYYVSPLSLMIPLNESSRARTVALEY